MGRTNRRQHRVLVLRNAYSHPYLFLRPWTAAIALLTLFSISRDPIYSNALAYLLLAASVTFAFLFWWQGTLHVEAAWASFGFGIEMVIVYFLPTTIAQIKNESFLPSYHTLILGIIFLALSLYEIGDQKERTRVIKVLRFIIIQIYFFAALTKLTPSFLSGFVMEQIYILNLSGSFSNPHPQPEVFTFFARATVAIESAICVGLVFRHTRKATVVAAVIFHAIAAFLMPVMLFSSTMIIGLMFFLPEDSFRSYFQSWYSAPVPLDGPTKDIS